MKLVPRHFDLVSLAALSLGLPAAAGAQDSTNTSALPIVPAGFEASIFANEPMVRNPCAMTFDARGRLFVGQGPQYRSPKPETPPDSVVLLEDRDGDGVAETRKIFATGLNCVQGLAWRGRDLWVANAPDLTIVRDLDGDDVADEYVRVFTDLGNIEHGLHGLNWSPDGRLYMSKGNSKGLNLPDRHAPKPFRELWDLPTPEGAVDTPTPVTFTKDAYRATYQNPADNWGRTGGVLRCDDLGANLEIFSRGFRNPWDITFDSGFNWLGTDNDQNEGDRQFMPFYGAHFGWGHGWSASWTGAQHPPTVPITGPTYPGSGTGIIYYDAPQFPEKYRRVFFWNDWLRKTTFIYRPQWKGALLHQNAEWEKFATASHGEALYRPVDIEVGPDGALWLTGWGKGYGVEWAADGSQTNEGRIFRIAWKGAPLLPRERTKDQRPQNRWTFDELAEELGSHLAARRVNAQRELVERGEVVREGLRTMLNRPGLSETAETWACWTLGQLKEKSEDEAQSYFAGVARSGSTLNARIQALRILGYRSRRTGHPLPSAVTAGLRDTEPRIRFEAVQAIWQSRQTSWMEALRETAATESDRVTFYSSWGALRDLAGAEALRAMLRDGRTGVQRAALLALADLHELTPDDAQALAVQPATADLAALWLAKRSGNPLITIDPGPGEFDDEVKVQLIPGMKPSQLRYTIDGSIPTLTTPAPKTGLVFRETTTLKVAMFVNGTMVGAPAEAVFRKRANNLPPITLNPPAQPTTFEQAMAALPGGNVERGHSIFAAPGGPACATCHRMRTEGRAIGPDLTNLAERGDAAAIVRAILEPNAIITEGFALQTVVLRGGQTHAGILREETAQHLTLVQPGGDTARIERAQIQTRTSSPASLMPPFGPVLTAEQIADVVVFLSAKEPVPAPTPQTAPVAAGKGFAVETKEDRLVISHAGQPVATYVFRDGKVLRPHFANLFAPGRVQVTRNHPPIEGRDATDHDTMHPGLWMAFGDVSGNDFWRNKGTIRHERFVEPPVVRDVRLNFVVLNTLIAADGQTIGTQTSRIGLIARQAGYLVVWDAAFTSDERDFTFGDQEEMGFGVRVATGITEKNGGVIRNSAGGVGAKVTWGKTADWSDYSGRIENLDVGILVMPDPKNFRASWFHNRDYGLMVANPFGQRAFTKGEKSVVMVKKGEVFRVRFGALFHAGKVDLQAEYKAFKELLGE